MDEQYVDRNTYRGGQVPQRRQCVSLTGVLVPVGIHRAFRNRFYMAVATALNVNDNIIPIMPEIHASRLFPEHSDEVKLQFLKELVAICADLKFRIYRVGYFETSQITEMCKDRKGILSLCFSGLLHCLEGELARNEIWPVMESDNSAQQDCVFAGTIQNIDYLTTVIGSAIMSVNNDNLGELHYSTKRSAYGTIADCVSYLLDASFLQSLGLIRSPFKAKVAEIAFGLKSTIAFDEIIELKIERPPQGYVGKGPLRYAYPITPTD